MKKTFTYLRTLLVGLMAVTATGTAWAQTSTTLLEYGTEDVAWTTDGLAEWTAGGSPSITNGYVHISGGNGSYETSKTISPTANAIINVTAEWRGRSNTGRAFSKGNGSYFRFGNIIVAQNDQDQMHGYGFTGIANMASVTTFSAGSYRTDGTAILLIEATINTAKNLLTSFTIKSQDGNTTYVTQENVALTSADYTTVAFGYRKGSSVSTTNFEDLISIKISEEEQEVTNADYTINYIFEEDTKKTETGTSTVDATINAVLPITIDGQKYYAADGASTSMTLIDGENVLDVELRKALTSTVNINAVDGESNVLKTFSEERIEGDAASNLYYTRAVEYNGKYYTIEAANGNGVNYGRSMAYGAEDIVITYTLDENITYYAESEDLNKSRSFAAEGNAAERASGGHWYRMYASSQLWTAPLPGGVYSFDVSGRNQSSNPATLAVKVRLSDGSFLDTENEVSMNSSENKVCSFTGIEVPAGASIALVELSGYNSNIGVDYVIAYRTGDGAASVTATIGNNGYTTFASPYALDLSSIENGVTAYTASLDGNVLTFNECTGKVPTGTGLLLKGEANANVTIAVADEADDVTSALTGVTATAGKSLQSEAPKYYFVMNNSKEDLTFSPISTTTAVTVPQGKAYVSYTAAEARNLTVKFNNETTAISNVAAEQANGAIYNLAGQRVATAKKGLYIENGKKVIK